MNPLRNIPMHSAVTELYEMAQLRLWRNFQRHYKAILKSNTMGKARLRSPLRRDRTSCNWKIGKWQRLSGRHKRVYDHIQLVADRKYPVAESPPCSSSTTSCRHKRSYKSNRLSKKLRAKSAQTFVIKWKWQLVVVSSIVSQGDLS